MSDIMGTAAVMVVELGLTVGEDGWCRWSVAVERDWRGTALFWRGEVWLRCNGRWNCAT